MCVQLRVFSSFSPSIFSLSCSIFRLSNTHSHLSSLSLSAVVNALCVCVCVGESWGHASTVRVVLSWSGSERQAALLKSPTHRQTTVPFVVTVGSPNYSSLPAIISPSLCDLKCSIYLHSHKIPVCQVVLVQLCWAVSLNHSIGVSYKIWGYIYNYSCFFGYISSYGVQWSPEGLAGHGLIPGRPFCEVHVVS